MKRFLLFIFMLSLLNACVPGSNLVLPIAATSTEADIQTATPLAKKWSVREIMDIILASHPQSDQYDPNSIVYAEFPEALKQLQEMRPNALKDEDLNVSYLAAAIGYPRRDSVLVGDVLLAFPPEYVSTTMPILISYLSSSRGEVRKYALILLGYVGDRASCAVGNIGPILFLAKDPSVRSASAIALDNILKKGFVPANYRISSSFSINSIPNDDPEGSFTGKARAWWKEAGSKVNWHPSYDLCDP